MFAKLGHTKESLKSYFQEAVQLPADWIPEAHTWVKPVNGRVPMMNRPEDFDIIVAGGEAGFHAMSLQIVMSTPVTKPIRLD
jgi:hypothetical protein